MAKEITVTLDFLSYESSWNVEYVRSITAKVVARMAEKALQARTVSIDSNNGLVGYTDGRTKNVCDTV